MGDAHDDRNRKKSDRNRSLKILAIRRLEQMILTAVQPDFTGSIEVNIAVDRGLLGRIETHVRQIDRDST